MHLLDLDSWRSYDQALAEAKEVLRAGGYIIYPTDTLYGIGANALDGEAVAKVVEAKRRVEAKPISIIVSDLVMMRECADVPENVAVMLQQLLPGPFTILLRKRKEFPPAITAAGVIGVRIPHHIFITTVVRQLGFPITATSANLAGGKGPWRVEDVPKEMLEGAGLVVDGGPTRWKEGSTVIDFTLEKPQIVRKGAQHELAAEVIGSP